MTTVRRLDGGVPADPGASDAIALAALTRRVAELEHRLDMMKIIVGLVLAAKVLLVVFVLYVFFGIGVIARSGGSVRPTAAAAEHV